MTATETEIVECYETLEMPVEDISKSLELDPIAIKAILAQYSTTYRRNGRKLENKNNKGLEVSHATPKPAPQNDKNNFLNPEERELIVETMKGLAMTSENDMVRARMCTYLFEEDKGRNEARIKNLSNMKPNGVNVNVLNINIMKTKARLDDIRKKLDENKQKDTAAIDIESMPVASKA